MRIALAAFLLPLAALATPTPLAPLWKRGETIDDAYIVVFKKDVQPQQMALHLAGLEGWHAQDVSILSSHHCLFVDPLPHSSREWPARSSFIPAGEG